MKTGKITSKFQYVEESSQLSGSHAEFPVRVGPTNQKYNPHSTTYIVGEGSGSFTAQIDPFRQGVSVLTDAQRAKSSLPVFETKDAGGEEKYVFGNSFFSDFSWPFIDKPNMENIGSTEGLLAFAKGNITTASFVPKDFEVVQANKRYILGNILNGTAEALSSIHAAFEPHIFTRSLDPLGNDVTKGIKAGLTFGNESYLRGVDPVQPLIPMKIFGSSPYVDKVAYMGTNPVDGNPSGSIALDNRVHSIGENIRYQEVYGPRPFDDSLFENRMFTVKQTSNMSNDMKVAIAPNVSGSTEDIIPPGFKSARTGFIFTNNGLNVDSIAFGGLRNDA